MFFGNGMTAKQPPVFVVQSADEEPMIDAIARALDQRPAALAELPFLTNVALGDPYLAEQLAALHKGWAVRPEPSQGLLGRIRTRLAWWLLGPELQQINAVHGTLVRLVDSLIVQLDQDRAARRQLEEQLAYRQGDE